MTQPSAILEPRQAAKPPAEEEFIAVNEMRLSPRQWLLALAIVAAVLLATPRIWKMIERVETGPDYRIPYRLSYDYWLCQRRLERDADPSKIIILGDSVIWGEYVSRDGTLSHFLAQETHRPGEFLNAGVNGLFPLAMEGLVEHYAPSLRGRKIILHCNPLWLTSPKADLSTDREETFNHSRLVPQFRPRIPCYKADANERLSVLIERNVGFSAWVGHLQNAGFDQRSIPAWTLKQEGEPPRCPNAWRNPLARITLDVPTEGKHDPLRGPASFRHKPWWLESISIYFAPWCITWFNVEAAPTSFDWVSLDASLQWAAFRRTIRLLRDRGDNVLVIVGPFNEHMIAPDQRPTYGKLRDGVVAWLAQNRIPCIVPDLLASALYADASHPLTDGYALLARQICKSQVFQSWIGSKP